MTTVSKSNLANSVPIFIRDVLRQNITDPVSPARTASEYIFKGQPTAEFNPPILFIDEMDNNFDYWSVDYSKTTPPELPMLIFVWADKMQYRDDLVNQIGTICGDISKTDGTDTIESKQLYAKKIKSRTMSASSISREEPIKVKRIGEVKITWKYGGS